MNLFICMGKLRWGVIRLITIKRVFFRKPDKVAVERVLQKMLLLGVALEGQDEGRGGALFHRV